MYSCKKIGTIDTDMRYFSKKAHVTLEEHVWFAPGVGFVKM
jgi:hypothetical protein